MKNKDIERILNATFIRDTNIYRSLTHDRYVDPKDIEKINQFLEQNGPEFYIHWFSGKILVNPDSMDNLNKKQKEAYSPTYLLAGLERDFRNGDIISPINPHEYGKYEFDPSDYPNITLFLGQHFHKIQSANVLLVLDDKNENELLILHCVLVDGSIVTTTESLNWWAYDDEYEEKPQTIQMEFNGYVSANQAYVHDLINLSNNDEEYDDDDFETVEYTFSGFIDGDVVSLSIQQTAFPNIYDLITENFDEIKSVFVSAEFKKLYDGSIAIDYLTIKLYLKDGSEVIQGEEPHSWPTIIH